MNAQVLRCFGPTFGPWVRPGDVEQFFDRSPDLLAIADRRGCFTCLNPEWEAVLGWSRDELMAEPYLNFVHPKTWSAPARRSRAPRTPRPCTTRYENRLRTRDGVWRWLLWSARWDGSEWSAVAKDITTRKELERHSLHDALTGVANRALATDRLSAAIARSAAAPALPSRCWSTSTTSPPSTTPTATRAATSSCARSPTA